MMELKVSLFQASQLPEKSPRFHIFAGHDTVIAPVLAALGIYQSSKCKFILIILILFFYFFSDYHIIKIFRLCLATLCIEITS